MSGRELFLGVLILLLVFTALGILFGLTGSPEPLTWGAVAFMSVATGGAITVVFAYVLTVAKLVMR